MHAGLAIGVVRTLAGADVEQFAGDVGEINLAGVLVFEANQAAFAAAVAKAFPLRLAHFAKRLRFPEGFAHRSKAPTTSTCGLQRN